MYNLYFNNITARVDDPEFIRELRSKLRTFAPGYKYSPLYKRKLWNGKVSLVDKEGSFPTGFVPWVAERYKVNLVEQRFLLPLEVHPTTIDLRDYQYNAIKKAFLNFQAGTWWPRGVIAHATGSGKTVTAAAMIQMAKVPTLFLTNQTHLVTQTFKVFHEFEIGGVALTEEKGNLSRFSQGYTNSSNDQVLICTVQSLMSWAMNRKMKSDRLIDKEEYIKKRLASIQQIFIDEAHQIGANKDHGNLFVKALELMPNAYMRWGLTATPFLREEYHDWLLEGYTGSVIDRVKTKELIEQGYLAKPDITMFRCPATKIIKEWPECYDLGIVNNDQRNRKIIDLYNGGLGPTLIFVERVSHANILSNLAKSKGLHLPLMTGEMESYKRDLLVQDLRIGNVKGIVSTVADQGIDIPELQTLIVAGGGKSERATIQMLGRGTRLAYNKSSFRLFDFIDTFPDSLYRHSLIRKKVYLSEGHEVKEAKL